jgi:hypothetical protein
MNKFMRATDDHQLAQVWWQQGIRLGMVLGLPIHPRWVFPAGDGLTPSKDCGKHAVNVAGLRKNRITAREKEIPC